LRGLRLDRRLQLFVTLSAIFCTALVVGDIIGGKLYDRTVLGFTFRISVGMIPFPITFLLTDILNEFYGKRAARFITWVGFGMAVFAFLVLGIALQIPWAEITRAPGWQGMNQVSFDNVFGGSRRILFASMIAYVVGQFSDIAVFNRLKRLSHNRLLWLRATGSTVVSQLIDTVAIQFIAWWGLMPVPDIFATVASSYAVKLAIAVGLTPFIYALHALVERVLKIQPVVLDEQGEPVSSPASAALAE
jgi:queuosine precursor transporter